MRRSTRRRGAVLVLAAVSVVALTGVAALAVDFGMLLSARAEAQRAADAAALAGASAFRDVSPLLAPAEARVRALDIARRNTIRRAAITDDQVTLTIIPDSAKVRVVVARADIALAFARALGIATGGVSARAAAQAQSAGAGQCVRPFAVPDFWNETSPGTRQAPQDVDGDRVWDADEGWNFEPPADRYERFDPASPSGSQTGLGSAWRNATDGGAHQNDYGRQMTLKAQDPTTAISSGFFYPFRIGTSTGAQDYRNNIAGCNPAAVGIGEPYSLETGNMVGPTRQGVEDLIAQDAGARWDPRGGPDGRGAVVGSTAPDWRNSPRVIPIALFDPNQIASLRGGSQQIRFNNIALMFIEGFAGNGAQAPVVGRFLYFASGTGPAGPATGSLVRVLRLVE